MIPRSVHVVIACYLTASAGAAGTPAPGWLQPEVVPGTIDSRRPAESAVRVRVVLIPDGRAVALTATDLSIVEMAERPRSGTWSSNRVTVPSGARSRPAIATGPGGTLVAAWRTQAGDVRVQDRDPRGRWQPSQVLASDSAGGIALAVGAAGDAVVAWTEGGRVRARTRQTGEDAWTGVADISDGSAQVTLDPSGANVDPDGTITVTWVESTGEGSSGVPSAAVRGGRDDTWGSAQVLPGHPSGRAGAPVLSGDSAGTVTAVWASRQGVTSAVRTAASRSWVADARPAVATGADSIQLASAVDVNGRAVLLAAERSGASTRWRVLLRDGAAENWTALGTASPTSTDRLGTVAVAVARSGDALTAVGRRGAGCTVDVARIASGSNTVSGNGEVASGCEAVTLSTDALGNALIAGVMNGHGGTQILTALRPADGLDVKINALRLEPQRIVLRITLPARARVTLTLVRDGAGKRRVERDAGPGSTPFAVGTAGLPAGRYTLIARAQSGGLTSPPVRTVITLSG